MALKKNILKEYLSETNEVNIKTNGAHKSYRVFDDPIIELSKGIADRNKEDIGISEHVHDNFSSLSGLQRRFLFFIYECCKKCGRRSTDPLSIDNISISCGILKITVQKIAQRLEKKGKVIREAFKVGRGGWTKYKLPADVYNEIMHYDNDNKSILDLKSKHPSLEKTDKIHINETINNLPEDWKNIKYESLEKIKFSKSQLKQLYINKLNVPEVIQESINHFSFGLENNQDKFSKYSDPLSVLMKVLRDGGAWIEKNYESPKDKAIRKVIEEKKRQQENHNEMIKYLTDIEFPEWRAKLSEEVFEKIVPEETRRVNIRSAITAALKIHFTNEILLPRLEQKS